MLRVAEQYAGTDTGRQRRANEDSLLARAPLFVVADGMGGARAGEVASRIAVEMFAPGIGDPTEPEAALATLVRDANARIYERSHRHADQAGMGTTLTALYVGAGTVSIAHVGDSRAYRLRGHELQRLTDDHSLVDELIREGRLTPEEAVEHPQRSVITRALGPESAVDVDTLSVDARAGDVFLLCSDGLTTMVGEDEIERVLSEHARLRDIGEALIAAANEAGGRDNISVVLVRVEEVSARLADERAPLAPGDADGQRREDLLPQTASMEIAGTDAPRSHEAPAELSGAGAGEEPAESRVAQAGAAPEPTLAPREPVRARAPRRGPVHESALPRRSRKRRVTVLAVLAVVLALVCVGAYVALQSVYFIGTNNRGLVTLFRGVPFRLPLNIALYQSDYVTGVSASTITPARRSELLDHSLRSEGNAITLLHSLELGQLE
jgi:protein phosphatase